MKNKTLKWILIALGVILLGVIIWMVNTYREPSFNEFEFEENNLVSNQSSMEYIDTVVHAGLKVIGIDSIVVIIKDLDPNFKPSTMEGYELKAHIMTDGNQYVIWMKNLTKYEAINVLSHELIHLKQYYTGKLKIEGKDVLWNGELYKDGTFVYEDSPWEKEAFGGQNEMDRNIREFLIKK